MDLLRLVGRNVRRMRSARGWSQEQLAEKSELSQQFISRIEAGIQNPTLKSLGRLADALDVAAASLLDAENFPES